ncbi:hypothetical protein JXR93_01095 [bacterium]|nr:hypothetical protein [bacterium]
MKFIISEETLNYLETHQKNPNQKPKSAIKDETLQKEILKQIREMESSVKHIQDRSEKAILYYEIGLIWKDKIGDIRNAMINFQRSYESDDHFLPNLKIVREIFTQKENWDFVLNIIDTEVSFIKDRSEKIYLLTLKAEILSIHKDNSSEAEEILIQLYKENPESFFLVRKLKTFYFNRKNYTKYAQIAEEHLKNPTMTLVQKEFILTDLIIMSYQKKIQSGIKLTQYIKSLMEIPNRTPYSFRDIDWRVIAENLEQVISNSENINPDDIYILFRVYGDYLQDFAKANRILVNNYQYIGENLLLLDQFEKYYSDNFNWEKLIEIKKRKVSMMTKKEDQADYSYEIGVIYLDKLLKPDKAKEFFNKALEFNKEHSLSIKQLGKIYYLSDDIQSLIKFHLLEAMNTSNGKIKTTQYFKIAQIYQMKLSNPKEAISYYQKSLEYDSSYLPSIQNLLKLYVQEEEWELYIKLSISRLEHTKDEHLQYITKLKIGQLYYDKLAMKERALEYFLDLFKNYPYNNQIFEYIEDILKELNRVEELLDFYKETLHLISEEAHSISILNSVADISIRKGASEEAIGALKQILEISPDYLPAIQKLALIFRQEKMWEKLIELNMNEFEYTSEKHQKMQLMTEIATIYENEIKNPNKAIEYYQLALEYGDKNIEIYSKLENLYIKESLFNDLIELYEKRVFQFDTREIQSSYKIKIAEIYLYNIKHEEFAIRAFEEALDFNPKNKTAIVMLKSYYFKKGEYHKWFSLLQKSETYFSSIERAEIYFEMAQIYYFHMGQPNVAEEYLLKAISLKKEYRYYDFLIRFYFENDMFSKALKIKESYIDFLDDKDKIPFYEYILSFTEQNPKYSYIPIKEYVALFNLTKNDYFFYKLFDILYQNGFWSDLISLIYNKLDRSEESNEIVDLNYQLGEIYEYYLNQYPEALHHYEEVLKKNSNHYLSIQAQKRIFQKTGNIQKMIAVVQKEADITNIDPEIKLENSYKNAISLIEQFKKEDEGVSLLKSLLIENPNHEKSFNKLMEIFISRKDYYSFLEILDIKIEATSDIIVKEHLLLKKSEILIQTKENQFELIKTFEDILKINPGNLDIYLPLLNLYLQMKNYQSLIDCGKKFVSQKIAENSRQRALYFLFKAFFFTRDVQNAILTIEEIQDFTIFAFNDLKVAMELFKSQNQQLKTLFLLEKMIYKSTEEQRDDTILEWYEISKTLESSSETISKLAQISEIYPSFKIFSLYIDSLIDGNRLTDALYSIEKSISRYSDSSVKANLFFYCAKIYFQLDDFDKSLIYSQKSLEFNSGSKYVVNLIREIYKKSPESMKNVDEVYFEIIKKNIVHLYLIEDIFELSLSNPIKTYRVSALASLLKIKNEMILKHYRNSYSTDIVNFDFYEKGNFDYFVFDSDSFDLRKIFFSIQDGYSKIFRKTLSDYSQFKPEKISQKHSIEFFELFNSLKSNFMLDNLECYIKNDDSYSIDFIFPDNLGVLVPETVLKLGKKEQQTLLVEAFDLIHSLGFLQKYYSLESITDMFKAIVNFIAEETVFPEPEVQESLKLLNKGVSRNVKKLLFQYKAIIMKTIWSSIDFEKYLYSSNITAVRLALIYAGDINFAFKAFSKQLNGDIGFIGYNEVIEDALSSNKIKELLLYSFDKNYLTLSQIMGAKIIEKK